MTSIPLRLPETPPPSFQSHRRSAARGWGRQGTRKDASLHFDAGKDARHFLGTLPMMHPTVAAANQELQLKLSEKCLQGLTDNPLAAAEALRLSTPLWRTTACPSAVLCEAMAIAQGMLAVFYHDTFVQLLGSEIHKDVVVSIGGWECRSRSWVAGTAVPGGGGGAAADSARRGQSHRPPPLHKPCTHAAPAERLRDNDGHHAFINGETDPLLCASWATSLRWEPSAHINLSKFLDAAGGGAFHWDTKDDRGFKRKNATPDEDERHTIEIRRTNVVFALFSTDFHLHRLVG